MPSQKSFDIDDVLDRAADIFWSKGYQATSMTDLVTGMSLNKGSLYNAFGSKKALFILVLQKFEQDKQTPLLTQLTQIADPIDAIATFFDTIIAQSLTDADKKGCLIINTALELPHHDNEIQTIITRAIERLNNFFLERLNQAQQQGQIPQSLTLNPIAKSLVAMTVGIRVLARGAFEADDLTAIKSNAMKLIGH